MVDKWREGRVMEEGGRERWKRERGVMAEERDDKKQ